MNTQRKDIYGSDAMIGPFCAVLMGLFSLILTGLVAFSEPSFAQNAEAKAVATAPSAELIDPDISI